MSDLQPLVAAPQPPVNVFDLYERFAILEMLWQQRNDQALLPVLVRAYEDRRPIRELFTINDTVVWERVKQAVAGNRARVIVPAVRPRALEPFAVSVTTCDAQLDNTFAFRFKFRYAWKIELKGTRWWTPWKGETTLAELTPETLEPAVVQYAPGTGRALATVTIWNGTSDSVTISTSASFTIERSETLHVVGAMERGESWPLLAAAVVAIVTGISTQYAGNATFGSTKDYLTLFLTGAAVDWVKNAVQPSPAPAPAPTPSGK